MIILICFISNVLTVRIAETKGRTYAELDILFENKVPARRFSKTKIETLVKGTEGVQKEQAERIAHQQDV